MSSELPPVISSLEEIAERYDGLLIDQWGVLHNGVETYPEALEALSRLKAAGKSVVILSNSGRTGAENTKLMARMGIDPDLYDRVLSAGDDAYDALADERDLEYRALGNRMLQLSRPDDVSPLEEMGYVRVGTVEEADFLFLLSMELGTEIPSAWKEILSSAAQRGLPLVCANPDIERVNGEGQVLVAPGAVARHYESLGGVSHYHGKPHARIYRTAMRWLGMEPDRVLAIGDSLIHDVEGARCAGIDSLFILGGVHRDRIDLARPETLSSELARHEPNRPTWITERLRS